MVTEVVLLEISDLVVVAELDDPARRQLLALLEQLPRLCRTNGVRPAPQLLRLATALFDSRSSQEHASRDNGGSRLDASTVRLAHGLDEVGDLLDLSRAGVERF